MPLFTDVFRDEDADLYKDRVPSRDPERDPKYRAKSPQERYEKWRTWQMSDHAPLWIRIATDFADEYLERIGRGE